MLYRKAVSSCRESRNAPSLPWRWRSNLIFKDVTEDGDGESEEEEGEEGGGEEGGEEGDDGATGVNRVTEVKWSVPEGFKVANEPEKLDGSLIGDYLYLRWERYGWQIGKITAEITNATPRLFKSFHYRISGLMVVRGHRSSQ